MTLYLPRRLRMWWRYVSTLDYLEMTDRRILEDAGISPDDLRAAALKAARASLPDEHRPEPGPDRGPVGLCQPEPVPGGRS